MYILSAIDTTQKTRPPKSTRLPPSKEYIQFKDGILLFLFWYPYGTIVLRRQSYLRHWLRH